jgi:hypothetical protein
VTPDASTTPHLEHALAATAKLREAILAIRPSDNWFSDEAIVVDLVQHSIGRWALDLAQTFRELADALGRVAAAADSQDVSDHGPVGDLELALMKVVSARDALRAIAAQVFGSDRIRLVKPGVSFDPNESSLRRRLSELGASGFVHAGKLKAMFEQIAEHPAISLRNDVVHASLPFPTWPRRAGLGRHNLDKKGGILAWERGPLYPARSLDHGDIKPSTLFRWAHTSGEDGFIELIKLTETMATLVSETGVVEPPASVYIWPDGRLQLERPSSDWLSSGFEET